ncbi:hypothetical protein SDC9_129382 [bioreactor metagenome]|uniref:Uncharacterized protein n=1 Tax=bioreactor metagenome TaxID=1076179 RepID=A0A645CZL3_9ZZZZ
MIDSVEIIQRENPFHKFVMRARCGKVFERRLWPCERYAGKRAPFPLYREGSGDCVRHPFAKDVVERGALAPGQAHLRLPFGGERNVCCAEIAADAANARGGGLQDGLIQRIGQRGERGGILRIAIVYARLKRDKRRVPRRPVRAHPCFHEPCRRIKRDIDDLILRHVPVQARARDESRFPAEHLRGIRGRVAGKRVCPKASLV